MRADQGRRVVAKPAEPHWTESDSQRFIDDGAVFVPSREEQIATLCALIPARADEDFTVAELGAGAGVLARAVLEAFPRCRYVALDGSAAMRARLSETLHRRCAWCSPRWSFTTCRRPASGVSSPISRGGWSPEARCCWPTSSSRRARRP